MQGCGDRAFSILSMADITPPNVALFLGTEPVADPCNAGLVGRKEVSTRLLPFNLCVRDVEFRDYTSGVDAVCVKTGSSSAYNRPDPADACWTQLSDVLPFLMMVEGKNTVTVFARDKAGNQSQVTADVNFNPSVPPQVLVLHPTPAEIIARAWSPGETKTLEFQVSDDDTNPSEIKLIVSLLQIDSKGLASNYAHLGCNFKNSVLWKQCPSPELEQSAGFTTIGSDGKGSFTFRIPVGWDSSKVYNIAISAIDRSGNAAVISTQEANVKYEVLAGRSYKGIGSSPTRYQRAGEKSFMAVDRKGTLLLTNEGVKVDPFDRRTCRMLRASSLDQHPYDCVDVITTPYNLTYAEWEYDSVRDVFFAVGGIKVGTQTQLHLVEISFQTREVRPIFGVAGKLELTTAMPLPAGALVSDYTDSNLHRHLAFDSSSGRLFFRAAGRLFAFDREYHLSHIAGSGATAPVVDATGVAMKDMALPDSDWAFQVSSDGRVLLAAGPDAGWSTGSGLGVQYILEAPELKDANEAAAFYRLTPVTATPVGGGNGLSNYVNSISYDKKKNRFFAALAWSGHAYMALPAKGADKSAYTWTYFTRDVRSALTDNDLFGEGLNTIALPLGYNVLSWAALFVSEDLVYTSGSASGSVLLLDLGASTAERALGFGNSAIDQVVLGTAMKIDTPTALCLDSQGRVYYSDFSGLNRITLDGSGLGSHQVARVRRDFTTHVFRCDASTDLLYQAKPVSVTGKVYPGLAVYDLNQVGATPRLIQDGLNVYSYDVAAGLGNDFTSLKRSVYTAFFNPTLSKIDRAYLSTATFSPGLPGASATSASLLSSSDLYSLGAPGCAGGACAQGGLQGGLYYNTSEFRLAGTSTSLSSRSQQGVMAFDSTDENIFGCANSKFIQVEQATGRVYPFALKRSDTGASLACSDNIYVFSQYGGKVYFARDAGVFEVDAASIKMNGTAKAIPVALKGAIPTGIYSDLQFTASHLYFSERQSGRVLRIER